MGRRIVDGQVVEVPDGEGVPVRASVDARELCETGQGLRVVGVYVRDPIRGERLDEVRFEAFGAVRYSLRSGVRQDIAELARAYASLCGTPEDQATISNLRASLRVATAQIEKLERTLAERAVALPTLEDDDAEAEA